MPLRQNSPKFTLCVITAAHLAVDLACFYLLYGFFRPHFGDLGQVAAGFLLYNVIAFGFQPLIGAALDRHYLAGTAPCGCLLVAAALPVAPHFAWLGLILAALGNACLHAAGGLLSLRLSRGRAALPGLFVSSGAVGVSAGIVLAAHSLPMFPVVALLLIAAVLLSRCGRPGEGLRPFALALGRLPFAWLLALILAAVVIRALAGGLAPMNWRSGDMAVMLAGAAAAVGKALGGLVGDRWGFRPTALCSLLLSLPLLVCGGEIMWLSLTGLVLFNMAMPLTLCATAALLPKDPGLAFGLTTLALLLGTAPLFFLDLTPAAAAVFVVVSGLVAALCLHLAFGPRRKENGQISA